MSIGIHGAKMINPNDFGDPFSLAPSSCQNFTLSDTLVYGKIPANLIHSHEPQLYSHRSVLTR